MKNAYWLLPLLFIACKKDKPSNSTIFGNGDDLDTELIEGDGKDDEEGNAPNVGKQYTDLELPTIEGEWVKLSDFVTKNKVTVVHCWASWNQASIEELPHLAQLYRKYHPLGVEVVGISIDTDYRAWNNSTKIHDMVWPQLGEQMGWNNHMFHAYNIEDIPHTIVIKGNGEIVAEGVKGESLINAVAKALK